MMRSAVTPPAFIAVAVAVAAGLPGQAPQWQLNEISTLGDYVELRNLGAVAAAPDGLCLWSHDTRGNSAPCSPAAGGLGLHLLYEVPAGQPLVPPGGRFVIHESAATPCGIVSAAHIAWSETSDMIVWLNRDPVDPRNGQLDMVAVGDVHTFEMANGTFDGGGQWFGVPVCRPNRGADAIYRPAGSPDTNTAFDWRFGPSAELSPCATNPGAAPNPLAFGQGFSEGGGNCAAPANASRTTALPTLTIADQASFDPTANGSFVLSLQTGLAATTPPLISCVAFDLAYTTTGAPPPLPGCASAALYLPLTAGQVCLFGAPAGPDNAGPVLTVPVPPGLAGLALGFQALVYDADPTIGCPIRTTNGLRITLE